MKKVFLSLPFLFTCLIGFAQEQNNIWYFGEQAGLDFSSGSPVAISNSALNSLEGSAMQLDASGNLLFYTNGGDFQTFAGAIWNRNHQVMPNGNLAGESGCNSSVQSTVIVPHPGNSNQYFVFTTDCQENGLNGGLAVNVVDMSLDGGLGDVVTKDSILYAGQVNENLCAIRHQNGTDYWIIAHKVSMYDFLIIPVTSSGIGTIVTQSTGWPAYNGTGQMATNITGNKFAYAVLNKIMLFDFNNTTGVLSNYVQLNSEAQALCFSANCRYLYASYVAAPNDSIFQFDLQAPNIETSRTGIAQVNTTNFQMQLGPDGKIYMSRNLSNYLGVINNPDSPAAQVTYTSNGVSLGSGICRAGLPNLLVSNYGFCGFNSGKNEVSENNNEILEVYPNPTQNDIYIKNFNGPMDVQVFSVTGQLMYSGRLYSQNFSMSFLSNGMYWFMAKDDSGKFFSTKIILEK